MWSELQINYQFRLIFNKFERIKSLIRSFKHVWFFYQNFQILKDFFFFWDATWTWICIFLNPTWLMRFLAKMNENSSFLSEEWEIRDSRLSEIFQFLTFFGLHFFIFLRVKFSDHCFVFHKNDFKRIETIKSPLKTFSITTLF